MAILALKALLKMLKHFIKEQYIVIDEDAQYSLF